MRIISEKTLREFWEKHPDAEPSLRAWRDDVRRADWEKPTDITDVYNNASTLPNNRARFDIKHNTYRLVVAIHYKSRIVFIRFIGTHNEYDKIDAATI